MAVIITGKLYLEGCDKQNSRDISPKVPSLIIQSSTYLGNCCEGTLQMYLRLLISQLTREIKLDYSSAFNVII